MFHDFFLDIMASKCLYTCIGCRGPFYDASSLFGLCLACENTNLMKKIKKLNRKIQDEDYLKEQTGRLRKEIEDLEQIVEAEHIESSVEEMSDDAVEDPDYIPGTPLKENR